MAACSFFECFDDQIELLKSLCRFALEGGVALFEAGILVPICQTRLFSSGLNPASRTVNPG